MKKLKGSLLAKTIAVIFFCVLCLGCAFSAAGVGMLYSAGYYERGAATAREELAQNICMNETWSIAGRVYPGETSGERNANLADSANYRYEIYDSKGALRFSNYHGETTIASYSFPGAQNWYPYGEIPYGQLWGEAAEEDTQAMTPAPAEAEPAPAAPAEPLPTPRVVDELSEPFDRPVTYTVTCYLLSDLTERDNAFFQLRCFDYAAANDSLIIAAAVIGLALAIVLGVFLLCAAGHRRDTDEIRASFVEKIPFDLFTVVIGIAGAGVLYMFVEILDHLTRDIPLRLAVAAILFVIGTLLGLLWCMSFAVRVKQRTLVKGTVCYKLCRLLWRAVKAVWGWLVMLVRSLPLVWRGLLIFAAAAFVGLLLAVGNRRDAISLWLAANILLAPFVVWALAVSDRLRRGAKEIANGNTGYAVPTKYLFGECKEHAEDLNRIQSGISRAVEERLRSERMKTELITNVSHDIKTPLTSIISYVDLLSKEEIGNEQAREYIEVLQRQSARLKKLTDDLVEASKASSGTLGVTIEDSELGVMLEQAAGEYGEKLAERNLELVLRRPEGEVKARADARHTQRIFDNLMNNILKYALPGTRVYLELKETENGPTVIFRNTSRSEIVQSPEELTERFVRGDASRSSEGSGLGLSIARSLAELQGGSLAVTVDGDLFKVTLGFAK